MVKTKVRVKNSSQKREPETELCTIGSLLLYRWTIKRLNSVSLIEIFFSKGSS